jgi:hypothetical protein
MSDPDRPDASASPSLADYVERHAPELRAADVAGFLSEHDPPQAERDAPYAWAVRVLRERSEGEHGEGLSVDRVVGEIRQRRLRDSG